MSYFIVGWKLHTPDNPRCRRAYGCWNGLRMLMCAPSENGKHLVWDKEYTHSLMQLLRVSTDPAKSMGNILAASHEGFNIRYTHDSCASIEYWNRGQMMLRIKDNSYPLPNIKTQIDFKEFDIKMIPPEAMNMSLAIMADFFEFFKGIAEVLSQERVFKKENVDEETQKAMVSLIIRR